ncbi:MAG: sulfatase-like hydrolase/transferase [Coraliomargaritaceae bacterium]
MKSCSIILVFLAYQLALQALPDRPNIIVIYADDISAREFPVYGSSVWTAPDATNTSDRKYRASTPVMDCLAERGVWFQTAWAGVVCNPSRAMMMSGQYAYKTKWWHNKDKGRGHDETGKITHDWPVYMSSPILMGHVAQQSGYGTIWSGKTQMAGRYDLHGFDEGCFTPGGLKDTDNPYADFKHQFVKKDGKRMLINVDTGKPCETYQQHGWYWMPHVKLMNHPSSSEAFEWWPNTTESKENFGVNTYGPDVELDFCLDFIERKHREGKPFLVYHTTHLGHDAYNWLDPENQQWEKSKWPNTPIVRWDGHKYTRVEPTITGDKGLYDAHGTITDPGIHHHINYIDYQVWLYLQKLEALGISDNTVIIITADNGTSGYGKGSSIEQRGCHVPFILYAPGMRKQGKQETLVSIADVMPTIAELCGFEFSDNYEVDGKSLVPFLFTDETEHRNWVYSYRGPEQLIRGQYVMRDGRGRWFDISKPTESLDNFTQIKDWNKVLEVHRAEYEKLREILPRYDLYFDEYDAPGLRPDPNHQPLNRYYRKTKKG